MLLVSVAALVVALVVGALVYRDQPLYKFLRGAERRLTVIVEDPFHGTEDAFIKYKSDLAVSEIAEQMRSELAPKGWDCGVQNCFSPDGRSEVWIYTVEGQTTISLSSPVRAKDRVVAWLDSVMGRTF